MLEAFLQLDGRLGFVVETQLVDSGTFFKIGAGFQCFSPMDVETRQLVEVACTVQLAEPLCIVLGEIQVAEVNVQQAGIRLVLRRVSEFLQTLLEHRQQITLLAALGIVLLHPLDVTTPQLKWI